MIQEALARGVESGSADRTVVHADVFLAELDVLRELRQIYAEPLSLGPTLTAHLKSMAADRRARETAVASGVELENLDDLDDELRAAGFVRTLKPFQRENLARVLRLPHAADFSVPGAGKTTLALALFAVLRHRRMLDRLMVVAPIAAFEAWKEETAECFDDPLALVIYRGPDTFVPAGTDVLVSNYHRVASDYHVVRKFVASGRTQLVLDEAHRVKRGSEGVHGRAVLDLAYAASRRDVLTGTPAPQGLTIWWPSSNSFIPARIDRFCPTPHTTRDLDATRACLPKRKPRFVLTSSERRSPRFNFHRPPSRWSGAKCRRYSPRFTTHYSVATAAACPCPIGIDATCGGWDAS